MRICEYLEGVECAAFRHGRAYSAEDAARAMGIPPSIVAKTLVLASGEDHLLAVIPSDCKLDLDRVREVVGDPHLALVPEESLRGIFPDCEIGTMPPLGQLHGLRMIVDSRLGAEEAICFQAGSHEDSVRISWREFARLESPTTRDITSSRTSP